MRYLAKFRDKTEVSLTQEQGEKLQQVMMSAKPPTVLDVDGKVTRFSEILSVEKDYDYREPILQQPTTWAETLQLVGGKHCRGQKSIQNEINNIAKSEGDGWQQRIQDKEWREATRLELRKLKDDWCDYKEDQCSCE